MSAGGSLFALSFVYTFSFPIATRCSLTPCSSPHIHAGREPQSRDAPASGISMCGCAACRRADARAATSISWTSEEGRSEFLAKSVPPGPMAQSVSHMAITAG